MTKASVNKAYCSFKPWFFDHYRILNNYITACTPLTTLKILSLGRKMMDKLSEEMVEEILDKLTIEEKMVFRLVSRKFHSDLKEKIKYDTSICSNWIIE